MLYSSRASLLRDTVLLTRKRGRELKDQIQRAQVEVDGHCVPFNPEATQWLGVWLDSGLNLKAHYQTCMRKARTAGNRVQRLCQTHGLAPGLARQEPLQHRSRDG